MAIVTIFGGSFGDDEKITQDVANTLGWRYVSREILVDAARRCDFVAVRISQSTHLLLVKHLRVTH